MTQTLASFTQIESDRLSILVDTEYANSLYAFLSEKKIPAVPPSQAIFKRGRAFIDGMGVKRFEQEVIVHEIIAKGTIQQAEQWVEEWLHQK